MLSVKKHYKNSLLVVSVALALGYLSACPAPVPEHVGCSSDDDCIDGRTCDEQSGLCLVSDAGEVGDANTLLDVQVEGDARLDDAAVDDAAIDDATIDDAAELDAELADQDDMADAATGDVEQVDAGDRDAALADNDMPDTEMPDTEMADTEMPDTEMPDNVQPDMGPDPHADAGPDQQVDITSIVMLSADNSVLPTDAQNTSYHWAFTQKPAGSTASLSGADVANAAFQANDVHGVYVIELTVTVDGNELPRDSVQVTVNNRDPQADAGSDVAVYNGSTVQVDASASSDPDDDTLTYSWSLADSSLGTFDDATSAMPVFTPDVSTEGEVVATVTVSDAYGGTSSDTLVITVSYNLPPSISAMEDVLVEHQCAAGSCNASAHLAATVSEPEGENFDLQWSLISCPDGDVDGNSGDCPSGVAANITSETDAATDIELQSLLAAFKIGTYTFKLVATDDFGNSSSAQVQVIVGNRPVSGNDSSESAVHSYNGSAYICEVPFVLDVSDADGDALHVVAYTVDPAGSVTPGSAVNGTFTRTQTVPDSNFLGPYTIVATVEDAYGSSKDVTVTVTCTNNAPSITGTPSAAVNVDHHYGSGSYSANYSISASVSDAQNDPVSCQWSAPQGISGVTYTALPKTIDPASGSVSLSSSMSASTTALIASHGLVLTCHDAFASSSKSAQVVVGNKAPIAQAGTDFSVHHTYSSSQYRATVAITGASASDPDGDPLSYAWTEAMIGSAHTASSVTNETSLSPTFNYIGGTGTVGSRNYTLTVKDSSNASATDLVKGTVDNRAPMAQAGADMSANHNYASSQYSSSFDLNSRSSKASVSDPDGDPLSGRYSWTVSAKSGVTYLASSWSTLNPSVTARGNTNVVGTHTLHLSVSDAFGASDSDDVVVTGLNRAPRIVSQPNLATGTHTFNKICSNQSMQFDCYVDGWIEGGKPYTYTISDDYSATVIDDDNDPLNVRFVGSTSANPNTMWITYSGYSQSQDRTISLSGTGNQLITASVSLHPGEDNPAVDCPAAGGSQYFKVERYMHPGPSFENHTNGYVDTTVSDPFSSTSANRTILRAEPSGFGACGE